MSVKKINDDWKYLKDQGMKNFFRETKI